MCFGGFNPLKWSPSGLPTGKSSELFGIIVLPVLHIIYLESHIFRINLNSLFIRILIFASKCWRLSKEIRLGGSLKAISFFALINLLQRNVVPLTKLLGRCVFVYRVLNCFFFLLGFLILFIFFGIAILFILFSHILIDLFLNQVYLG